MSIESENILNVDQITAAVNAAIASWDERHPEALLAEREEALGKIRLGISMARTKDKFLNSKANRDVRKQAVQAAAEELGLFFVTVKEVVAVDAPLIPWDHKLHSEVPTMGSLINEFAELTGYKEYKSRNLTFCFKQTKLGHAWKIDYSMAIQNPGDNLDGLIGKEYAVARMVSGMVLTSYGIDGKADDVGLSKLAYELAGQGAAEFYTAAYL